MSVSFSLFRRNVGFISFCSETIVEFMVLQSCICLGILQRRVTENPQQIQKNRCTFASAVTSRLSSISSLSCISLAELIPPNIFIHFQQNTLKYLLCSDNPSTVNHGWSKSFDLGQGWKNRVSYK